MSTSTLFESARLRYRAARNEDFDEMMEMYQDSEIQAAMMAGPIVPRPEAYKETVRGWTTNPLFVVAEDKETGKFIGNASLRDGEFPGEMELAMKVKKEVWGQGHGKEMLQWTVQHAFKWMPGVHRVSLGVFESNARAVALYKSVGFVQEGVKRRARWGNGKWEDVILMAIVEDEFDPSRARVQA
ncbi:acyl-CoA N-acyltransferase [Peniophora sp. CONT]|nr:acyl-CoA N-acyltransferase [Peniophora sp. CONT]